MLLRVLFTLTFVCHLKVVQLESPSVIIVGAGPAGIAAASKLLENSINNITILEAENRIGGRIHTIKFGESVIELGAEYCHGEKDNVIYELTKDLDVLDRRIDVDSDIILLSNGSKLSSELTEEIEGIISDFEEVGEINNTSISLQDHFTDRYSETILRKYKDNHDKLEILKNVPRFAEGILLSLEGAFSWSDVSAKDYYQVCEGHQMLIWKGVGYKTILDILMKKYPDSSQKLPIDDKIQLNSEVEKISWDQDDNIIVRTSDNRTYSGDYVIFTPSIGVLKQQKDSIFNPPLPSSKQDAINAIGFGGVIKIFLHFPTKWWNDEEYLFSFLWKSEDLHNISFNDGPTKNGVSWVSQIRTVSREFYTSNVWVVWITGDLVPEIEKLPQETLKRGTLYVLDKFLGRYYNITEIDDLVSSKWCSNKHFLGTYSYLKAGNYKEGLSYNEKLSEPLENDKGKPVVLFAGETTHPIHYSTVHGAIETGFREAERIIQLHKEENKI